MDRTFLRASAKGERLGRFAYPWYTEVHRDVAKLLQKIIKIACVHQCILASIIVVALKGMLMKVTEFKKFWKLDRSDGVVWAVTFASVVLLDVEYGLLIGIVLCIGKLILFSVHSYTCTLALVPGTELYLDTKRYKGVCSSPSYLAFSFLCFCLSVSRFHQRSSYRKLLLIIQVERDRRGIR